MANGEESRPITRSTVRFWVAGLAVAFGIAAAFYTQLLTLQERINTDKAELGAEHNKDVRELRDLINKNNADLHKLIISETSATRDIARDLFGNTSADTIDLRQRLAETNKRQAALAERVTQAMDFGQKRMAGIKESIREIRQTRPAPGWTNEPRDR